MQVSDTPPAPLPQVLTPPAFEELVRRGADLAALSELYRVHAALRELEDQARGPSVPAEALASVTRAIAGHEGRRCELVERFNRSMPVPPPEDEATARVYGETPGELCARLFIADLELEHARDLQHDATLPEEARRARIDEVPRLRGWRAHLQRSLQAMLEDVRMGWARLPPRSGFRTYDDPLPAPVARDERDTAPAVLAGARERRHVLGIAPTGHGASIAYINRDGVVRSSVLDRWAGTKHTLLFAEAELADILGCNAPIDAEINRVLRFVFGRFPDHRVCEQVLPDWLDWLLDGTGTRPDDIDLVVTSESHFATCSARLGPVLNRWFPRAQIDSGIEHHAIHQRQAFWASGFDEAAVLTLDACGEDLPRLAGRKIAGTIARMDRGGACHVSREFLYPESSPGLLYGLFNHYLGFRQGDEGKTMGLAPYGRTALFDRLRPFLRLHDDGSFEFLDTETLVAHLRAYAPVRLARHDAELTQEHADIAYAAQALLDAVVANAFAAARRLTGLDTLAYAGGTALNSVSNELARATSGMRRLYIPPNPGDTGHALGCALYGAYELSGWDAGARELGDYLGPAYPPAAIERAARATTHHALRMDDSTAQVARVIANGHIVARFEGGAEFGPRALGNRSILADARRADMKDHLNAKVKHREGYRPFAPSVLEEHAADWFDLHGRSAYMLRVVPVREAVRNAVPAITHVDGSARVQTVARDENPSYWSLIRAFHDLTGVPLVLNTSFNTGGKPIVETPDDAVACFESTEIDVLALSGWVLSKRPLDEYVRCAR